MKSALQVMKFGGTSVGDASCILRAAQIVAAGARAGKCVAVVSAMSGVTNRLIEAAKTAQCGNAKAAITILEELAAKHESTLAAVVKNEAERAKVIEKMKEVLAEGRRFCEGTALLRELSPRTLDAISSLGGEGNGALQRAAGGLRPDRHRRLPWGRGSADERDPGEVPGADFPHARERDCSDCNGFHRRNA